MFYELFTVLAPVVIVAAVGFAWAKAGQPFDNNFVSTFNFNVATPLLIFSSLTKLHVDLAAVSLVAFAALVAMIGVGIFGTFLLLALRIPLRPYLAPVLNVNTGNVGLPVCFLAFGDEGLALAVVVHVVSALIQFTIGVSMIAGTFSVKDLIKVPLLYAVALAFVVSGTGVSVPPWIANAVAMIGQLAIPMMLVGLGVSLVKLRVTHVQRSTVLALARLGLGFAAAYGAALLFGFSRVPAGVLILQISMPTAVFTYLMAARYNTDPEGVAGVVFVSTLLGFVSMPLVLLLVL